MKFQAESNPMSKKFIKFCKKQNCTLNTMLLSEKFKKFTENKYYLLDNSHQGSNHRNFIILVHILYRYVISVKTLNFSDNSIYRLSVKFPFKNHTWILFLSQWTAGCPSKSEKSENASIS